MKSIIVQLGEKNWTLKAMHLACAIARNHGSRIDLLRMMPVQHVGWLGAELGKTLISSQDYADVVQYCETAEDYGVEVSLCQMQYVTVHDALAQAAAYLEAGIMFASLPHTLFRPWRRFLLWQLTWRLQQQECQLFTLEPKLDANNRVISITLPPAPDSPEAAPPSQTSSGLRYHLQHLKHRMGTAYKTE